MKNTTFEKEKKYMNMLKEICYGAKSTKMLAPHIHQWGCYVDSC